MWSSLVACSKYLVYCAYPCGNSNNRQDTVQLKDELCEVVAEMEALDSADDGKNSNKTKMMSMGRKKFNMDPKKGIEFLIEKGLLQQTAESVAQFLHKGEGLNKTAIGDYLGEKNEFNEKVLQAFVDLHDFRDLILVQALRPLHFCRPSRHICIQ
ncbi:Sec7 domain [Popillia japonica]|uniref:Sec7 domain n=1 Tax=Popillia japonica TaxID=7064 RepID=A0AAW1MHU7_POPJA